MTPKQAEGNVLADGIFFRSRTGFSDSAGKMFSQTVTLPSEPCDDCTLQVMQVMENDLQAISNCYYHHCANIKIVAADSDVPDAEDAGSAATGPDAQVAKSDSGTPPRTGGSATHDSGTETSGGGTSDEGSSASTGSTGNTGSTGSTGTTGTTKPASAIKDAGTTKKSDAGASSDSDGAGADETAKSSDDGCAVSGRGHGGASSILSLLFALGAVALGRRRRNG